MTVSHSASEKKEKFLDSVEDCVSDLCYYNRKNDEELSISDVKQLLESGAVTMEEIFERFKKTLKENFNIP